jgi:chromosome segregation ATPase
MYPGASPYYPPDYASSFRGEMQQAETRMLSSRLQMSERSMAELHRAVADAVTGLRSQLSTLTTQIGAAQDRPAFASRLETIERSVAVMEERVVRAEKEAEAAKQQVNVLHSAMAEDFITFEQNLQKQEKAVDSARTAMAQTDDLVERLVEALEALQSTVLERSEDYSAAVVN